MVETGPDMGDGSGVRWLTYDEAGRVLGIDAASVARRARRMRWRRQPGNDARTLVAVPLDAIPDTAADMPAPDAVPSTGPDVPRDVREDTTYLVRALEGEVAALRDALTRERGRADQAEAEAREARQAEAAARERAARAEGARDALQVAMGAAEAARQDAEARAAVSAAEAAQARQDAITAQQDAQAAREAAEYAQAVLDANRAMPWWRRVFYRPG